MGVILEFFRPISIVFGWLMSLFYETMTKLFAEPQSLSYFAITILLMAVVNKIITIPLMAQTMKSSQKMQNIQPKIEALKKKYGYDERILNQKMQELYKEEGAGMAGCSSCLPMLIQMILILTLFEVLREPGKYLFENPDQFALIQKNFFWIGDLSQADPLRWLGLPLVNMLVQLALQWLSPTRQLQANQPGNMNTTMMLMPVVFYFMSIGWASGLLLYWIFGNLLEVFYRLAGKFLFRAKPAQ